MTTPPDLDLTLEELRAVVRFAADCAAELLPVYESSVADDRRPREALDAARSFADGAARSNLQRTTAFAAHRAAKEAPDDVTRLAALACADAAGAAYLHPLAQATQVGHVLRSAACVARVAELRGDDVGRVVAALAGRAAPPVPAVLRRYPAAPGGRTRLAELLVALDAAVRDSDAR
ncbi:MAG: exonuclease SbcC [Propionibacteriales bacterium]|nr:exonuclease SbcC [Propionibacteriales bacterium]